MKPPDETRYHEQVMSCVTRPWQLLVVVATEPGLSARPLADAIVERCNLMSGARAKGLSAEKLNRGEISDLLDAARDSVANGTRVVIAVDPLTGSHAAAAIAMTADAAIVCVHLGRSTTAHALKTIDLLGRERVIGVVTLAAELRS
jgi:hypothetical protein